jgi:aldehyde:ferredoxin oxidoreductase
VVCAKSPATNLWAESNCGGFWGPELRYAGYDGVLFTGKADSPVYVWIKNDHVEIRDATHVWGSDTYQTQTQLKTELKESLARIACIGIAGEQMIPYALIMNDHGRVAGRTGLGAVMGSKNLKAIAVRGGSPLSYADPAFKSLRSQVNVELRNDAMTRTLRDVGTAGAADYFDYLGEMPSRYYTRAGFSASDKISGATLTDTILSGVSACHACVIACGRKVIIPDGVYQRGESKGPEYETIVGFGPNLEISDLPAITHFGQLCDSYGMDTISLSNTIGLAHLLYAEGLLTVEDTRGLEIKWGDVETVEKLIHLTARREGFGKLLALGAKALAKKFNAAELAVQVNGLELAYHDPRGATGMGLVYATSPRGGCHNQSDYFIVEIGGAMPEIGVEMVERTASAGKAASVARHQWWRTVNNSLVMCVFANVPFTQALELVNLALGFDYSAEEFLRCGERGWALKRAINTRLGLTAANDKLPKALLTPHTEGGSPNVVPDLPLMLREYYAVQGWDAVSGKPTRETLERLGLKNVADDLWD